MGAALAWLETLSPWPSDGFGTERMYALVHELGDPQNAYDAIHVVGTNGKSTATRAIEELLHADGFSVGSTISPHVRSWAERIRIGGREVDMEKAIARVRPAAMALGATQFETITAAAFTAFAEADIDVAAIEAGLGGRFDATNVLSRTRVVLLTNVSLEHTDVLGSTEEQIAREKLAVAHDDTVVVLPDNRFAHLVPGRPIRIGGTREAAEAFARHALHHHVDVTLPGRLERRNGEIRDGAHNPDGVRWLLDKLEHDDYVIVASILGDKDVDSMLRHLADAGRRFVATQSSSPRAIPAAELAGRARAHFDHVETVDDPVAALARAHELGDRVLVTGSLYLLSDLEARTG